MSKAVYVWMAGGLGNQLFQYATGYALARKLNCGLKLDLTQLAKDRKRKFGLSDIDLPFDIASNEEVARWQNYYCLSRRLRVRWNVRGALYPPHMFLEQNNSFDKALFQTYPPIYLRGYWQSEKYFANFSSDLRKLICSSVDIEEYKKSVMGVSSHALTVSVHVRLGDYQTGPTSLKFKGSCQPDYYRRAISHMKRICPHAVFVVFSDDPVTAADLLTLKRQAIFVNGNTENPIQDLLLMSHCHHHIIANSSFSWWGAWLNNNPEKVVIGPRRWFSRKYLKKHDLYDMLPSDWLTLDSNE